MKRILYLVFGILSLSATVYAQAPLTTATLAGAHITFVNGDSVYDFGGIPAGSVIDYQFDIKNTGDAPLIITEVKCESANVQCKWSGKSVKPGKKGMLTVTYTAHGEEGSFKNDIYITSNTATGPRPLLHVTGAIIPASGNYVPSSTPSKKGGGKRSR